MIRRDDAIEWELGIPLLTNRHVVGGLAKAFLGGAAIVTLLVGLLLGVQGEWKAVPGLAALLFAIGGALLLAGLVVMGLAFGNRLRTRFTVDSDGVRLETVDRVARVGSRGSFLLGLALGSGAAAGAGLLAAVDEDQAVRWSGAFRAVPEPATHSIAFRNGWRTLLRLYCPEDRFEATSRIVQGHMDRCGTAARCRTGSPVGAYLLRTALVVVATLPVFAVGDVLGFGLLPPLLLLCFAVATVWFVRPMAWVVLGILVAVLGMGVAGAFAVRTSQVGRGTYLRHETISGDDWAMLVLAALGMAGLAWLAIATIRRKIAPALTSDLADAGDDAD